MDLPDCGCLLGSVGFGCYLFVVCIMRFAGRLFSCFGLMLGCLLVTCIW